MPQVVDQKTVIPQREQEAAKMFKFVKPSEREPGLAKQCKVTEDLMLMDICDELPALLRLEDHKVLPSLCPSGCPALPSPPSILFDRPLAYSLPAPLPGFLPSRLCLAALPPRSPLQLRCPLLITTPGPGLDPFPPSAAPPGDLPSLQENLAPDIDCQVEKIDRKGAAKRSRPLPLHHEAL